MSKTLSNIVVAGINIALYIDGTEVGYTQDGVECMPKVEHYDIEADQSTGILGKRKIKETMRIKVNAEEATIEMLKIAMGEENTITNDGSYKRLSFGGGQVVTEHLLRFEGVAPGTSKTRRLHIYKAVSVDVGGNAYKKGEMTLIPLVFEAIMDTAKPEGEQYGYYEDAI